MSKFDTFLVPTSFSNLRDTIYKNESFINETTFAPVVCYVRRHDGETRKITIPMYPFDTLYHLKYHIYNIYKNDAEHDYYHPRFQFIGTSNDENNPTELNPAELNPFEFSWFSNDTHELITLSNPSSSFEEDLRFSETELPSIEIRGHSTMEKVFMKKDGTTPIFHVFLFRSLLDAYKRKEGKNPAKRSRRIEITDHIWATRFAPYFPDINPSNTSPSENDREFADLISTFIEQRNDQLDKLNELLEKLNDGQIKPIETKVTGIRQIKLIWNHRPEQFNGVTSLFYDLKVTEQRPYIRLYPTEGMPITKLHVNGVLPIPSLKDPQILEVWSKDTTYTPEHDFSTIKYVHYKGNSSSTPIYGTIHLYNDGTINLTLQPPKTLREFNPKTDFSKFRSTVQQAFLGLHHQFNAFDLKEISVKFTIKLNYEDKKITAIKLRQRLLHFQAIFKEIPSLPKDSPILSLRYKAVNQYHTEEPVMTFISQLVFDYQLKGEEIDERMVIDHVQKEFNLIQQDAQDAYLKWIQNKDDFTIQNPEENEFIDTYHPGTDIHIYAQHPSYFVQVNRITEYESYFRIFTFLSLLFLPNDEEFADESVDIENPQIVKKAVSEMNEMEEAIEKFEEPVKLPAAQLVDEFNSNSSINSLSQNKGKNKEKNKERNKEERQKAAQKLLGLNDQKPIVYEDQRSIAPKGWFLKRLQWLEPGLFGYKKSDLTVYSRACGAVDDRQPNIMSKEQYERMREIYSRDSIHWIIYNNYWNYYISFRWYFTLNI